MQSFTTASLKGQGNVEKVQYYREFTDDVVSTGNPDYRIPKDYIWVRESRIFRFLSALCYGAVWITGLIYCKGALHMRIKGRKVLAEYRGTGFFLYANHTQPFGDVVMPAYVVMKENRQEIPVFFTIDDQYAPYLAVAMVSLMENASRDYDYRLHVVHKGLSEKNRKRLSAMEKEHFKVVLVEMDDTLKGITDRKENRLRCDYFTLAINHEKQIEGGAWG